MNSFKETKGSTKRRRKRRRNQQAHLTLSRMTLEGFFIISAMVSSGLGTGGAAAGAPGSKDGGGGGMISFSLMTPPPLLLVFSTCSAVEIPCCWRPRPWPSLKPYLAIILAATPSPPAPPEGVDSCSDGGGAMAAPPAAAGLLGMASSSSSLLVARPAKPVPVVILGRPSLPESRSSLARLFFSVSSTSNSKPLRSLRSANKS